MGRADVSVIVPVYNVEGTVEATVKSILVQTYKNIEILLIDDGSTDKSGEICDKFALDDNRIKVIHKKNGGVSSARNTGIRSATADFLCFVDADDEIEPNMIETLVENQKTTKAQLVIAGITEYHKKLIKVICEDECCIDCSAASGDQIVNICPKYIMPFTPSKLFFKNIFTENNLFFKEGLVCGEDHLLIFQYLCYSEKVSFINESLYRYYCFNSNGSTRFFPLSGQIDIFKAKESFVRKYADTKTADEYCARNALRNLIARFNYLAKRSIKNYEELAEAYDVYWPYIVQFVEQTEVFLEDDKVWFSNNRKALESKKIKEIYIAVRKGVVKSSKRMRYLREFFSMPIKDKMRFIIKKIK